jgi:hypothetical protein
LAVVDFAVLAAGGELDGWEAAGSGQVQAEGVGTVGDYYRDFGFQAAVRDGVGYG